MKNRPYNAIAISLFLTLIFVTSTISAEIIDDPSDDVFHWAGYDYTDWSWDVGDRPNIDIIELNFEEGSRLTLSMKVAGTIKTDKVWYHMYFNTSDAMYHVSFMPDDEAEPFATAFPIDYSSMSMEDIMNYTEPNVETSFSGDTITATIDWVTEEHEMTDFWAMAQEWLDEGEAWSDYYIDFAPNDYSDFGDYEDYYGDGSGNSGDSGDSGDSSDTGDSGSTSDSEDGGSTGGTPGFEAVGLIAALGIAFIVLRRRR